jgi:hypothetical protein
MEEKINLAEKLALVNEYWSPAVLGRLNDYKIQVVKVKAVHLAQARGVWGSRMTSRRNWYLAIVAE